MTFAQRSMSLTSSFANSSGVSAGTDMALALIARLHGHGMAVTAARNMEHIWNEDATNDPFA